MSNRELHSYEVADSLSCYQHQPPHIGGDLAKHEVDTGNGQILSSLVPTIAQVQASTLPSTENESKSYESMQKRID